MVTSNKSLANDSPKYFETEVKINTLIHTSVQRLYRPSHFESYFAVDYFRENTVYYQQWRYCGGEGGRRGATPP